MIKLYILKNKLLLGKYLRGRHGHDHMVVGFSIPVESVPITTKVVSLNPVHGKV